MILVIDQGAEEIQNWLPNQLPPGITYFVMPQQPTLKDHIVREDPPTFGIDLREIPEHTSTMNKWLGTLKNTLRARLKMWLKIINDRSECICAPDNPDFLKLHNAYEGSGWICPPDNPAFQKLRAAYEKITGIPSTPLGKLHGNDGRFFNGKAVVWGQKGIAPHGAKEAHDIGSILPYLKILDEFGESLLLSS